MRRGPFEPEHFAREDEGADRLFYAAPRLVAHLDEPAMAALRDFYGRVLPQDGPILDLMASYVSHLPETRRAVGLGLNAEEMRANAQLSAAVVHDLNAVPSPPFRDGAFRAAVLTVSVQYLKHPVETFEALARALAPEAPVAIACSNRCFLTKAIALWRRIGLADKGRLVAIYLGEAGLYRAIETHDISPAPGVSDPLLVVTARRA